MILSRSKRLLSKRTLDVHALSVFADNLAAPVL